MGRATRTQNGKKATGNTSKVQGIQNGTENKMDTEVKDSVKMYNKQRKIKQNKSETTVHDN